MRYQFRQTTSTRRALLWYNIYSIEAQQTTDFRLQTYEGGVIQLVVVQVVRGNVTVFATRRKSSFVVRVRACARECRNVNEGTGVAKNVRTSRRRVFKDRKHGEASSGT